MHSNTVGESGYGLAVLKNSYLKHLLSQAILDLSEQKILVQLEEKWLSNTCKSDKGNTHEMISLQFFATPFLLVALAACLCGAGTYVERYADSFFLSKRIHSEGEREKKKIRRLSTVWNFQDVREGYMT